MRYSLEVLEVRGDFSELGRAHGEHFRERIRTFVAVRIEALRKYTAERGFTEPDAILAVGERSRRIHAAWDPDGHAEHLGIAEGAGVDPLLLYTYSNMTDMRDVMLLGHPDPASRGSADPEGCTSALVPGALTRGARALVGQTWDLNPTDVDFVVAIHRRPSVGPQTWSLTCAGCLTLVGMNERGLAVGTTNIKVSGGRPGVGYLDILHRAVRCASAAEASAVVRKAPRAGAHTYWLADADEQIEWEAAPHLATPRPVRDAPVVRSNHCLAPDIASLQGEPTTESSRRRLARMQALASAGGLDVDGFIAAFADRADGVDSINRYPEDEQGTATNGVFIAEPATRRLWACRGPADRGAWMTHQFGDALAPTE